MVSAIGVAAYGHLANHEDYIDVLRKYSSDPYGDIAEYVKRDIANQAFGNPDNHGRNTAISKGPLGGVSIAPLYDFAPMRLAVEGISRSTRWAAMRDTHRDTAPDWAEVCRAVFPESLEIAERLLDEISDFGERSAWSIVSTNSGFRRKSSTGRCKRGRHCQERYRRARVNDHAEGKGSRTCQGGRNRRRRRSVCSAPAFVKRLRPGSFASRTGWLRSVNRSD
ncbi:HipA domain-containing protein [Ensifer adhaerens]|nr:HipA domain-containing protein [Ensifer adhaerens]